GDGNDLYRAFLEIRLLGNRIGGVQGDLVDQPAGIEPGNEDHAAGHAIAPLGFNATTDLASPRYDAHFHSLIETPFAGISGVHETNRSRERLVQFWNAHGHRSGVPVL